MNFWTFLDRNLTDIIVGAILLTVVGGLPMMACFSESGHRDVSGCGVKIQVGSSPSDGGAP